ncbi:MAG: hypothetical protein Q8N96_01395 [Methylovulum sp.]|nr:hypothetical protein [Methylovulum sp.]
MRCAIGGHQCADKARNDPVEQATLDAITRLWAPGLLELDIATKGSKQVVSDGRLAAHLEIFDVAGLRWCGGAALDMFLVKKLRTLSDFQTMP